MNLTDGRRILRPNLFRAKKMLLNVPETGISSHIRRNLVITESIFSVTQVLDKFATVKCQDIFDMTWRLYGKTLFLGCKGFRSISFISSLTNDISSDLCSLSDISKSKKRPRYLKDSPILILGMRRLPINSFGRYWADLVKTFFIPKVLHLSTLIIISDH